VNVRELASLFRPRTLTEQIQASVVRLGQAACDADFWRDRWLERVETERRTNVDAAEADCARAEAEASAEGERRLREVEAEYAAGASAARAEHARRSAAVEEEYNAALNDVRREVADLIRSSGFAALGWDDPAWARWSAGEPGPLPRFVRLGMLRETARSVDWTAGVDELFLPALAPFLDSRNLIIEAPAAARMRAVPLVQSLLVRLLATVPPGKLRFTFLDPVSLGENVAAFLHLADFNEALVHGRAWTEPYQVEQRLVDLTAQMEEVIQKYLRNQYPSIQAFNEHACEVAEPYRVLVAFDFPSAFSDSALRRLLSIMRSGPRCGVHTVLLRDPTLPLPDGFDVKELRGTATTIAWDGRQFVWDEDGLRTCSFDPDLPPDLVLQPEWNKTLFGRVLSAVGQESRESNRVEVPFPRTFELFRAQVAVQPDSYPDVCAVVDPDDRATWWRCDATNGLRVPLGRAGATRVRCLELGQGTAHHVLVAGRTGSGKSTLLHALITGLALSYSPDELQFYLVDLKKGVEFKTYASHRLPHAAVVALDSDRGSGLNVLRGLDAELERRGELFRAAGAGELSTYGARVRLRLPRILLVVDEFQELFAVDDALAAEAARLLDRLARQGRSFGVHLLLASQSLAGAFSGGYTLAASTVDQMQVRIALQCGDADSRLILAGGNGDAQAHSRPGQAIYNAASGALERNDPCQIAWLPDHERDRYLAQLAFLARERGVGPAALSVIEPGVQGAETGYDAGSEPAQVAGSVLDALLAAPATEGPPPCALLGEPGAGGPAVVASFQRRAGGNLLIAGGDRDQALGLTIAAIISLAATHADAGRGARFLAVDLTQAGAPIGAIEQLAADLPGTLRIVGALGVADAVAEARAEVERRSREESADEPSLYVVLFGLHRIRDLQPGRVATDGRGSACLLLLRDLATVLRYGPDTGVHGLVWSDGIAGLTQVLGDRSIEGFSQQVLLSGDAGHQPPTEAGTAPLVHGEAIFGDGDDGRNLRFRPYTLPTPEWLDRASAALRRRHAVGAY
jgi:hypothetical protein